MQHTAPAQAAEPAARPVKTAARYQPWSAAEKAQLKHDPLPNGWRRVPSRSRPGEVSYECITTRERVTTIGKAVAVAERAARAQAETSVGASAGQRGESAPPPAPPSLCLSGAQTPTPTSALRTSLRPMTLCRPRSNSAIAAGSAGVKFARLISTLTTRLVR